MSRSETLEQMLCLEPGDNQSNPLILQLIHQPFPELAAVLRSAAQEITLAWDAAVREAMPQMRHLSFDELKDSTPQILLGIADALESEDPAMIHELLSRAPAQGLSRLELQFDVVEVMQEDRLLRAITVMHVEAGLGRRMTVLESAALHTDIDLMLQRSVIALVDKQKLLLRAAAETELKFLSFLSHDLNNNLGNVTLRLELLQEELKDAGRFPQAEESLQSAQKSIEHTVLGMRQMLEHERLRKSANPSKFLLLNLHTLAQTVVAQFSRDAGTKGVALTVEISPDASVDSDSQLLSVLLQNLVGNAVKYSSKGVIRVGCDIQSSADGKVLWVSDEGPGIDSATMDHLFEAFRRGEVHGQPGVGLGLSIASHAAKLLGATLTAKSVVGRGTTFYLHFSSTLLQRTGTFASELTLSTANTDQEGVRPSLPAFRKSPAGLDELQNALGYAGTAIVEATRAWARGP